MKKRGVSKSFRKGVKNLAVKKFEQEERSHLEAALFLAERVTHHWSKRRALHPKIKPLIALTLLHAHTGKRKFKKLLKAAKQRRDAEIEAELSKPIHKLRENG